MKVKTSNWKFNHLKLDSNMFHQDHKQQEVTKNHHQLVEVIAWRNLKDYSLRTSTTSKWHNLNQTIKTISITQLSQHRSTHQLIIQRRILLQTAHPYWNKVWKIFKICWNSLRTNSENIHLHLKVSINSRTTQTRMR